MELQTVYALISSWNCNKVRLDQLMELQSTPWSAQGTAVYTLISSGNCCVRLDQLMELQCTPWSAQGTAVYTLISSWNCKQCMPWSATPSAAVWSGPALSNHTYVSQYLDFLTYRFLYKVHSTERKEKISLTLPIPNMVSVKRVW